MGFDCLTSNIGSVMFPQLVDEFASDLTLDEPYLDLCGFDDMEFEDEDEFAIEGEDE